MAISWEEVKAISVKACIQSLKTNPFNKQMFAGGTVSGDLYIWCCENENNKELVNELFSESTQNGAIVGIDWVRMSSSNSSYGVLTCHDDGYVIVWKIGQACVRHKT
jgi:WD repeat-containing protein 34